MTSRSTYELNVGPHLGGPATAALLVSVTSHVRARRWVIAFSATHRRASIAERLRFRYSCVTESDDPGPVQPVRLVRTPPALRVELIVDEAAYHTMELTLLT